MVWLVLASRGFTVQKAVTGRLTVVVQAELVAVALRLSVTVTVPDFTPVVVYVGLQDALVQEAMLDPAPKAFPVQL